MQRHKVNSQRGKDILERHLDSTELQKVRIRFAKDYSDIEIRSRRINIFASKQA